MIFLVLRRYGLVAALALILLDMLVGTWLIAWEIKLIRGAA